MELSTFLFLLIGVAFTMYAIFDGFDLGAGIVSLFTKDSSWHGLARETVAPIWDSNGVWLVLGGGGLLAAFPMVYATVFSGFYLAVILLMLGLLFRAISVEFHDRSSSLMGQQIWMKAFGISSLVIALVLGVAFGNVLQGISLDSSFNYIGGFWELFTPFPLMVGLSTVSLFASHGSMGLAYKHEASGVVISKPAWFLFLIIYGVTTLLAVIDLPGVLAFETPAVLLVIAVAVLLCSILWIQMHLNYPSKAFFGSCVMMIAMMAIAGLRLFPNLIPSTLNPENSLTVYNAAVSPYGQHAVAFVICCCLPCIALFKLALYRTFRNGYEIRD